ncbi:MAG: endonuclease/exonuclease/phosphatase family protein [Bacteroidetes bacterium]|nr:endonuclease/exonuclease/phosphatase family protein [Bacteroidota bacterium]MBU1717912.1 endonuclease/exonuclease/phosphatase family protein [Bacteroidota bacterium]
MKKLLKLLGWVLTLTILAAGAFFIWISVSSYSPKETEEICRNEKPVTLNDSAFSIISWNIGYAGLGSEMDFFYEGGKQSRPEEDQMLKYLEGIKEFLVQQKETDFYFLQEIDIEAKRSHHTDQLAAIKGVLRNMHCAFAINYKSAFVPLPISAPMGKVESGLAIFSKTEPKISNRISLPMESSWPMSLFFPVRGLIENRYSLGGKELVLMNTHNSAYDSGSEREAQVRFIIDRATKEYEAGNFVVIGGDWNCCPPGFDPKTFAGKKENEYYLSIPAIQDNVAPEGWEWVFDPNVPTNRSVDIPLCADSTYRTIIDFFLISPNLEKTNIQTIDLGFALSDHNPITINLICRK